MATATVLRTLRKGARSWWANDTEEKVRRSVREEVRTWREIVRAVPHGAHATIALTGAASVTWCACGKGGRSSCSRTGCAQGEVLPIARALNIPILRFDTLSDSAAFKIAISGPIPTCAHQLKRDDRIGARVFGPSFDYCSTADRVAAIRAAGGVVECFA